MKLEQFVYGRVSRGLQTGGGYQAAATSAGVWEDRELHELLRQISYYPRTTRAGAWRPRYAFCAVGGEWYSFSRTVMAKDATSSVGYFAHHLLVRSTEVRRVGWLPFRLLREFPFFGQEADLTPDRRLPSLELTVAAPEPAERRSDDFVRVLATARVLLNSSRITVPALITEDQSDEALLRFVEQVLALFPLQFALSLAFCSHFTTSAENLAYYRFVSAPKQSDLPEPIDNFLPISPESRASEEPAPFLDWIRDSQASPRDIQQFILACSPRPERMESERATILADPQFETLPAALEHQWPDWARVTLGGHPRLFGLYYDRVPDWRVDSLKPAFSSQPEDVGESILSMTRHSDARRELAGWVLEAAVVKPREAAALLRWADRRGLMNEIASRADQCRSNDVERLADAVLAAQLESPAIYESLARRVLGGELAPAAETRLARELLAPEMASRFPGLAALLDAWQRLATGKSAPATLGWESISESDYRLFVRRLGRVLVRRVPPPPDELRRLFHPRSPELALHLALAAFRHQADTRHIVSAEDNLALSGIDRDTIIRTLTEVGDQRAVREYRSWAERRGITFSKEQILALNTAEQPAWTGLWQRIWRRK